MISRLILYLIIILWVFGLFIIPLLPILYIMHIDFIFYPLLMLLILQYFVDNLPKFNIYENILYHLFSQFFEDNYLYMEEKLDDRSMLCYHPHGVFAAGYACNGAFSQNKQMKSKKIKFLIAKILLNTPLFGLFFHKLCHKADCADKQNIINLMQNDENIALMPGGFHDVTLYEYGKHNIYLKKKKGFIKLALQHGYNVYAVYTFGEERIYDVYKPINKNISLKLNNYNIPTTIPFNKKLCPIMPYNHSINTVISKKIEFPKIENPTVEDIDKYHKIYVETLINLFNKYKVYFDKDAVLNIE